MAEYIKFSTKWMKITDGWNLHEKNRTVMLIMELIGISGYVQVNQIFHNIAWMFGLHGCLDGS